MGKSQSKGCWPAATTALPSHWARPQQIPGSFCRVGHAEREDCMELVISVVIGILIVEAYVWLPKISEWLIERAVQCLRSEDQDRCREEWKAGLDALPNTVIKLVHAFSYLGAARRINADCFENKLTEINALIEECVHKHSGQVAFFGASKKQLGRPPVRPMLDLQLSNLKARMTEAPNEEVPSSLQKA